MNVYCMIKSYIQRCNSLIRIKNFIGMKSIWKTFWMNLVLYSKFALYCVKRFYRWDWTEWLEYWCSFLRSHFRGYHYWPHCISIELRDALLIHANRQSYNISSTLVGNELLITQLKLEQRRQAHFRLNTRIQWIGQRQLQGETRNI